ncbi:MULTISPECIES: aminoglycoside phosphotransferase family protein [Burkholderiaceae]|jgi:hypothetical protein|uniref:Aminoglycoside phosphotransferase n=1 Tax=Paraburkholderia phytofirmans (strain DSM 17436 / LMG 22146 / PsJN) TaxID=398527 RepID=B2SZB5_PARPJ|nr:MULTISPECIES: aminoglycoside phosphotransferase family protein [Burkholderiaceae]UTP22169.1 aminoglycoside phosphotransferase family protein [Burkholderia sp. FXe9]HEP6277599.1 aminoglycoside phosphotransferase family protein [Burkholderia vietnamiensis]ACD14494.1 aminoglycoside phosphotransferase [Paraburkholderia phytofirmans PsJN]ERJ39282.1 Choline kinase [Burkholderia sp. AU4i]MBA9947779.1 aminoglycoside phosphotransferase family protein [Burkholderia cepacia]
MKTSSEQARLIEALADTDLTALEYSCSGLGGVASPMRLRTEWAGFLVQTGDGEKRYAKVLYDDMRPLIDVEQTVLASRAAALTGVTPALYLADVERGVLLFDALPDDAWRWARVDDLTAPDRLERLWDLKRKVHCGPDPGFHRSFVADIARLRALCDRDAVVLPSGHEWLDECVEMASSALESGRDTTPVPLHGDGAASNVMVGPDDTLALVDFDRGGTGDAWYDVAVVLNELYQFEPQWRDGIRFWSGQCEEADYARCRLYAFVDDWYWTLWGLWLGTTSSRRLEFTKLSQWTLQRCRQTIRDPRFEGWLRAFKG